MDAAAAERRSAARDSSACNTVSSGSPQLRWSWARAIVALAMLGIVLGGCGADAKAEFYYKQAFAQADRIERDPARTVRLLRGAADMFGDPERSAAYQRFLGVPPLEEGHSAALAVEWRARADAIEANPHLYAQTERCAADVVGERFRLEARTRGGPQPECGHCVGSPPCQSWRPGVAAAWP